MGYKIGLDLGVSSVGWATLETDEMGQPVRILDLSSRIFDKAENTDGSSLAKNRREARETRRRIRRRRHRRDRVLSLLENYNIITKDEVHKMYNEKNYRVEKNVYELRVEGLDTVLTAKELARVLICFVKRRGYKSNSKSEETENKDIGKLLTATVENEKIMKEHNYRTVAEMYLNDSRFSENVNGLHILKIRNTTNEYKATVKREDLVKEIKLILEKQKELNPKITDEFIEKYLEIFESQRAFDEGPGGNSPYGGNQIEKMLGKCTFEKNEPRAMKATYTFEYFKLLQDINHIKLEYVDEIDGKRKNVSIPLNNEQRDIIINLAKKSDTISFSKIRKELNLEYDISFNMVRYDYSKSKDKKEVCDLSETSSKLKEFQSYHKIRKVLDKVEKGLVEKFSTDTLDKIGYVLSAYKNDEKRISFLKENTPELTDDMISSLMPLSFSKTGNLSVKAMKKLIPYLEQGMTYDKAVENVYGKDQEINKKRRTRLSLNNLEEEIPNPVVKRAVSQTIKVLNAIVRKYGEPEAVNIELARELSKTFSERTRIEKENEEKRSNNEKVKREIEELGKTNVTGQDIIKYKLWKEQDEICIYSGIKIAPEDLFSELVDVDHIVPYSLSFDDSFNNKVLVLAEENRMKRNRVPLEYLREDNKDVNSYLLRIEDIYKNRRNNLKKYKKLTIESISREDIKGFKQRNLNDTQYISKVVHNLIRNNMKFAENSNFKRKVEVVNGTITSHIRKRLGIEKIRSDGDEHHAVDAAIIATVSPKLLQDITRFYQSKEVDYKRCKDGFIDRETGEIIDLNVFSEKEEKYFPEPYKGFRKELEIRCMQDEELMHEALKKIKYDTYENILKIHPIFVSRMPRRKVTGAAHKETVRGLRKRDNTYYSVTKTPLENLKLNKEKNAIEGYPEKQIRDDVYLYNGLLNKLKEFDGNAKEAFKKPFYKPNKDGTTGQIVKKVKIENKISSFVPLNNNKSLAENGSMIRIDVFKVEGEGYYFVPIYTANVLCEKLPNKASVANKPMNEWKEMRDEDFIFSLYPNDLVYIRAKKPIELNPKSNKEDKSKLVDDVIGYYVSADISSGSIEIDSHDSKYNKRGIGIKTLVELKKYEIDVLGNIHEVKLPEKRMDFKNMKGGRKA